jgi:hypothetical protein
MKKTLLYLFLFIPFIGFGQSVVVNKYLNASTDVVELLVITNNLDMRGMVIKDFSSSMANDGGGKYTFTTDILWSSIRSGTIIVLRNDNSSADVSSTDNDFNLDLGLKNSTYFSSTGTFDIATTEIVMIKTAVSGENGTTGSIHALAGGSAGAQFTSTGTPKLITSGTSSSGFFVYANNSNSTLADYNGTDATGGATGLTFGSGNNPTNTTYITNLRNIVLPISLTSFAGKPVDQSILLNWTTASESNNDYFEVLKSNNGKTFRSIGTVKGSGTTTDAKSYSFVDVNPAAGTNYYQLVQYDFDGKSSSSSIIPVNSAIANSSLTVYAATTSVNVSINSANQTDGTLQIFDITGKKLNETRLSLTKGFNTLSLPLSLNSGIHVVNFVTGAEVISSKFIKE